MGVKVGRLRQKSIVLFFSGESLSRGYEHRTSLFLKRICMCTERKGLRQNMLKWGGRCNATLAKENIQMAAKD